MSETARYQSPEARTEAIMSRDVAEVALDLTGRRIAIEGSGKSIVVHTVRAYTTEENLKGYKPLLEMEPGTLWVAQMMGNALPLVATLDSGKPGGCVRLLTAQTRDESNGTTGEAKNGKQMMEFLGIEKGKRVKLAFRDDSDTLFLDVTPEVQETEGQLSSDQADQMLNDVFGEKA